MDEHRSPPPASAPPRRRVSPRRRRAFLLSALLLAALIAAAVVWHLRSGKPRTAHAMGEQPQSVRVAAVAKGDLPVVLNALGTVTPLAAVTVRTQIAGTLQQVGFTEGQLVEKGDFLAQIDPRPYQILLESAHGTLAKDSALLQQAQTDLARYETLAKTDAISRQQVDDQRYLVEQYKGAVRTDQAQVDTYKLDLEYCRIVAPVAGRVGLRQVDPGNYVQTGDANGIVVITQLQPISVLFALPEDNVPAVLKRLHGGAQLSVSAYDRSNSTFLAAGRLQTVDNQVDTSTGTVKLRALFTNGDELLFPNQFVNVKLLVDTLHDATIVPGSAVQTGPQGQFVYVVKPDDTVAVRPVKTGPVDGDRTSIAAGLAPGETVVIDGVDRLREGAKIFVPAAHPQGASAATGAGASHAHAHRSRQNHA